MAPEAPRRGFMVFALKNQSITEGGDEFWPVGSKSVRTVVAITICEIDAAVRMEMIRDPKGDNA
ncbi:hypothetical protein [Lonsdalea quercina]|uniref:hypothetical protein n=1 Tax=Lonsdalea quercina TaxID=71657 RepID=UPI003976F33A